MKALILLIALCSIAQFASAADGALVCRNSNNQVVATVNNVNQDDMWECGGQGLPGESLCYKGDAKVASEILSDLISLDFFSDEMSLYEMKVTADKKIEFTLLDMPNESTTGPYTVNACK
jgi:hypothetical protein